ncbi:MAG: ATP phosphoribosyltransferase [Anaerolineae bacterium]|nr:ATP phosphoribosyltransferase [Calditrichota bacterium]
MTNKPFAIILPSKGAIADPTLSFMRDCGLPIDKPNQRQYIGSISTIPSLMVLFQRATDVLYKVADGSAQLGITGLDIVAETPRENVIIISDKLGYGHCSLVVAVPDMWVDVDCMADLADVTLEFRDHKHRNIRIGTKYPTLARRFLYQHNIYYFTLVKADGAIEAAPALGYADIIIDLTQTGTTLRENNLRILSDGTLLKSQACLIGNKQALQTDSELRATVRILLEYIDAAQRGKNYYQLVANIQGVNAEEIGGMLASNPITFGLQGPTISPIYTDVKKSYDRNAWFTLTIIIESRNLLSAIEYVRSIGGTQTIASPVRYVFLEESPSYQNLVKALDITD